MKAELVFSINQTFAPPPWPVGEVKPLFDERGELLAYSFMPSGHFRDELPPELFSHEMKDLNMDDPTMVAGFMSDYGLIGGRGLSELGRQVVIDDLFFADSHFYTDVAGEEEASDEQKGEIFNGYMTALNEALRASYPPESLLEDLMYFLVVSGVRVAMPYTVKDTYTDLMESAGLVKAILKSADTDTIERLLPCRETAGFKSRFANQADHALYTISKYLSIRPRLGYLLIGEGGEATEPVFPLDGRYAGNSVKALQRGVYIRKGKKIVVK